MPGETDFWKRDDRDHDTPPPSRSISVWARPRWRCGHLQHLPLTDAVLRQSHSPRSCSAQTGHRVLLRTAASGPRHTTAVRGANTGTWPPTIRRSRGTTSWATGATPDRDPPGDRFHPTRKIRPRPEELRIPRSDGALARHVLHSYDDDHPTASASKTFALPSWARSPPASAARNGHMISTRTKDATDSTTLPGSASARRRDEARPPRFQSVSSRRASNRDGLDEVRHRFGTGAPSPL